MTIGLRTLRRWGSASVELSQRLHAANLRIAGAFSIDLERHVIDLCRRWLHRAAAGVVSLTEPGRAHSRRRRYPGHVGAAFAMTTLEVSGAKSVVTQAQPRSPSLSAARVGDHLLWHFLEKHSVA